MKKVTGTSDSLNAQRDQREQIKKLLAIESLQGDHDSRIQALESEIENLKNSINSTSDNKTSAPVDNSQTNIRINLLNEELKKKADKTEVNHQAGIF